MYTLGFFVRGLCQFQRSDGLLHVHMHVSWAGARGALTCARMDVDMLGESWGILHSPEIIVRRGDIGFIPNHDL